MPKVLPEYKEEARRRIVQHAGKEFSAKGYYNTRMVDIAKSLGVSKGALYIYFPSKLDLLKAVLENNASDRGKIVQGFLDAGGIAGLATPQFFERMVVARLGSSALVYDLSREALENATMRDYLHGQVEAWVSGMRTMVARFLGQDEASEEADAIARGILALRDGLYGALSLGVDLGKAKGAWAATMRLLLKGAMSTE